MAYVYAVGPIGGASKIGITGNPKARMSALRKETVGRKWNHRFFRCSDMRQALAIERLAHELVATFRSGGEWFSVPIEDAVNAIVCAAETAGVVIMGADDALLPARVRTNHPAPTHRSAPLNLRVTKEEHAAISKLAKSEGLPVATFIIWLMKKEAERRGTQWPA